MKVLNIFACTVVSLLLLLESTPSAGGAGAVNPCCYYPCQHSGVCVRYGADQYKCDCTGTGYSGVNCTDPGLLARIKTMVKPSPPVTDFILTHFQKFWDYVNNSPLQDIFMRLVLKARTKLIPIIPTYNTKYGYLNWESYYNTSYYTRMLPPVPEDCPLPMGAKGKPALPDIELLLEKFFKRKVFKPDPRGANVMLAYMAHHFTHQFFHTNLDAGPGFTYATGHGVDGSHMYGVSLDRQLNLRLLKDGKLKYQLINGEIYPPTTKEANVYMLYPDTMPPEYRFAIGNEVFGLVPGLSLYATIWLREHNRVCEILKQEHPTWDDEQLFQTARLIVIGETIKIVIEEYVQQIIGYRFKLKFDPTLLFKEQFQYSNRIALEFDHLYHWHSLLPDSYIIDGDEISAVGFVFNGSTLTDYGVEKLVDSFSRQRAGQITGGQNFHESLIRIIRNLLHHGRSVRLQPFNEYRKKFDLKPYESFSELTDNEEIAKGLEEAYGDIDSLEYFPGLIMEKTHGHIFGESMLQMGAPFSLRGVMGNAICSPEYWKPSTFGGETGFNIVNTATLKKLVCLNTKWCPYVSFRVPEMEEEAKL